MNPDVGVVIHHKAPKNISSFIKEKVVLDELGVQDLQLSQFCPIMVEIGGIIKTLISYFSSNKSD